MTPCIGRRLDAVHALFQFHHHDFDGNDRVVDEQSEGDDQGAESDAIEHTICNQHNYENCRDGDRHRGSNHDTDSPS